MSQRIHWQDYLVSSFDLRHGDVCVRGTRIPVSIIVGSLADGLTEAEILQEYPQLTVEAIRAALAYAAEAVRVEVLV